MRHVSISPSLLAADKSKFLDEILAVEKTGSEYLHFDVMDGQFVTNTSFSPALLEEIHDKHHMINDVHIMIVDPLLHASEYLEAGADILTFHYEACKDDVEVQKVIDLIHSYGKKAGLSIKPNTPVDVVYPFVKYLDVVLIMSVEPGLGGQKFIDSALDKISALREYIDSHELFTLIEVDGGINKETGLLCREAGVDILVAGSYIFNSDNYLEKVEDLRR